MTPSQITALEQLLASASARPWNAHRSGGHGGTIYDSPGKVGTIDKIASVHCGGDCGTGWPNAQLIVELVNAAPQLLAVYKAALAWRETRAAYWSDLSERPRDDERMSRLASACDDGADALEAALSPPGRP